LANRGGFCGRNRGPAAYRRVEACAFAVAVRTHEDWSMKRWGVGFAVLAALWVLGAVGQSAAEPLYRVTDLGALPGGDNSSQAFAINNRGQVVGMSSVAGGNSHAFLYSNGAMADLGLLGDGQLSTIAGDINDSGHIVGHSFGNGGINQAFLYRNGVMTDLGALGTAGANGSSVNNSDHVVGMSGDATSQQRAFLWSNGAMRDLGSLTGSVGYGYAYGINDNDQVVGTSVDANGTVRGFLWQNGEMSSLGDLDKGLGYSFAFAINNPAQVVGYSGLGEYGNPANPPTSHPFIWEWENENGVMEDLGSLPGRTDWGYARGINDLGEVVGSSGGHAFVWDSVGGMLDLNGLLDGSGVGWEVTQAYDINNSGQIVGGGYHNGEYRGFLLTPVPEPSTLVLWTGLGAMGLLALWRRRKRAA
jgi:probable HAF family extracellular repeat protein